MRDKICIITGATAGIGLETAARLGALGARLLLVGRSRQKGEVALARSCGEGFGRAPGGGGDVEGPGVCRP